MEHFEKSTILNAPVEAVFNWHKDPNAIEKLTPPGKKMKILSKQGGLEDGSTVTFKIYLLGPIGIVWEARHQHYVENVQFQDVQDRGPFAHWHHTHRFEPVGDNQCRMTDAIEYKLPMGVLGQLVAGWFIRQDIEAMFNHRHQVLINTFNEGG